MLKSKKEVVSKFARGASDTGSPEVQVALLTNRIEYLTGHFKAHVKDFHGRRGLMNLVSKRRRLLEFLKREDLSRYSTLITTLDLRK
jgi:small subunit ribosomal protein S15